MNRWLSSVTVCLLCASLIMLAAANPALAQEEAEAAKAAIEVADAAPEDSGAWKAFMLVIFFFVAVCIGCFMSPKRTHQD